MEAGRLWSQYREYSLLVMGDPPSPQGALAETRGVFQQILGQLHNTVLSST